MPAHLLERMRSFNDLHVETLRRAHELGVTLVMGTDAGTPGNHHGMNAWECVFMTDMVGLSPVESIRAATTNAARLLGRGDELGRLDVGAHADVVAVPDHPLDDITTLTRSTMVMAAGSIARHDHT